MKLRNGLAAVGLLLLAGCAQSEGRRFADPTESSRATAVRSASVLLAGADGVGPLALQLGRSDWPSAHRDQFGGERGSYYELFYDVQGSPWGGTGVGWGGGSVWRRFRSDRVGSFER
ncbi:MAG: hypothetical protein HUU22_10245 [Phycisphaerae bacterium]|nr:hypothetical protein [Phycisphaerae bacterium]NUQ46403.1 hypothetical protein [Phycisphaerae bacterium]